MLNGLEIHTVGDSHAWHAWLKIPGITIHQLGPMTMYRVGRDLPIVVDGIPKDAIVIFCWGEIDCRCHVYNFPPWPETIDAMVRSYLSVVDQNAKITPNIWLFNVVPPPRKAFTPENPDFPFLGSDEERFGFVRRVNDRLRGSGYPFIDVYDQYCDKDGFLLMDKSDGHVHIKDEQPLIDWIEKKLGQEEESSLKSIPDL